MFISLRVGLAGLLVWAFAQASMAAPDAAQQAYDMRDFTKARALWLEAARKGDPAAAFGLGLIYDLGSGVPRDSAVAYGWYMRAANAGLPVAEFNLAVMNDSGFGVPRNGAAAALWYARAAAHGYARAAYNLGQLYAAGDGVPANDDVARAWYAAAAADVPAARERLAKKPFTHPILSADLVKPVAEKLGLAMDGNAATVELVWSAPPEPAKVRYFYTVLGIDGAVRHNVASDFIDRTATTVHVPGNFRDYAWRVYAVADGEPHYAPSNWQKFSLVKDAD